jgi:hypothetical protein
MTALMINELGSIRLPCIRNSRRSD